jgi:Leucine-rich repeat (LRR) protein
MMKQSRATYQGQIITFEEKEVLIELERLIGEPIPAIEFINTFSFGFRTKNETVVSLGLSKKDLTELPSSIRYLSSLQDIRLFHNQLKTLPDSFGDLKSLRFLNLVKNEVITLPDSFIRLESLQILYLNQNRLITLPEFFDSLKSLQRLNLRDNQLKTLPSSFSNLSKLEQLWVRNNPLDEAAKTLLNNLKEQGVLIDIPDLKTEFTFKKATEFIKKHQKLV